VTKFYYERTHKVVDIPDELADEYEGRRWYRRIERKVEVPDGSVSVILEWAGDDPTRRQAAIEAEQAGKNRATLLRALTD
jgi:hypothetical protein